ncbi:MULTISPECIES: efflux RND transporter periplasmic adaptor subunit [unclassified Schlesneria]|uniref:efflux RND transporter periplasmic adaptor subunit n=1 Tax=unclassified Schlesneria TaxID=2762017 RepID=UPI002EDDBA07
MNSLFLSGSLLLLLAAADPSDSITIEGAQLTLIEHAELSARESGVLSEIIVSEGKTIEADAPLAILDDQDAKLLKARAETEVEIARTHAENDLRIRFAKKSLDVARAELKRSLDSFNRFPNSVSQTELDRLKLLADKAELDVGLADIEVAQAKLTLKLKQHDLDRATLQLARRTIKAPFPGIVVQWKRQRGEWVDAATPVARFIRLNRLRAEGFLASKQATGSLVGRDVTFVVDGKKYQGKLNFVHPEIDPANQQVRLWAEIQNDDLSLRPGQIGKLEISAANPSH